LIGRGDDVDFADGVGGKAPGRTPREQITYSERGNIQGAQFFAVAYEAGAARGAGARPSHGLVSAGPT